MKYDVFISYSRKDLVVADKIHDVLDKAGVSCFIDRKGIGGGMEFPKVIATAIKESELFLFLASENSYSSKFTSSEITFAFNKKQKNQLLPYVIDSSSLPDELEFVFSSINIRNMKEHPIETTLVEDILDLLGRNKVHDPLCPCGSGKLFKDCHGRSVAPAPAPVVGPTPTPASKPSEKTWKVGDYYNVGGKEGVVFWVDETGKHGKIVSVDQTNLQWCTVDEFHKRVTGIATDRSNGMNNLRSVMKIAGWKDKYPAFAWCADHGDGWYLPAIDELKELLLNDEVHAKVNGTLEQKRVSVMYSKGAYKWYWSSTEYNEWCAWYVGMSNGGTSSFNRSYGNYVRAVSAF